MFLSCLSMETHLGHADPLVMATEAIIPIHPASPVTDMEAVAEGPREGP